MTIHNITRQEAESTREYHQLLTRQDDPSLPNAQTFKHNVWRVSGKLKTWKRSPERFEQPVKYGMYQSSVITDQPDTTGLTGFVLTADTCHVCKVAGARIGTAKVQRQQRDSTQSEIADNGITIRVRYIVVK